MTSPHYDVICEKLNEYVQGTDPAPLADYIVIQLDAQVPRDTFVTDLEDFLGEYAPEFVDWLFTRIAADQEAAAPAAGGRQTNGDAKAAAAREPEPAAEQPVLKKAPSLKSTVEVPQSEQHRSKRKREPISWDLPPPTAEQLADSKVLPGGTTRERPLRSEVVPSKQEERPAAAREPVRDSTRDRTSTRPASRTPAALERQQQAPDVRVAGGPAPALGLFKSAIRGTAPHEGRMAAGAPNEPPAATTSGRNRPSVFDRLGQAGPGGPAPTPPPAGPSSGGASGRASVFQRIRVPGTGPSPPSSGQQQLPAAQLRYSGMGMGMGMGLPSPTGAPPQMVHPSVHQNGVAILQAAQRAINTTAHNGGMGAAAAAPLAAPAGAAGGINGSAAAGGAPPPAKRQAVALTAEQQALAERVAAMEAEIRRLQAVAGGAPAPAPTPAARQPPVVRAPPPGARPSPAAYNPYLNLEAAARSVVVHNVDPLCTREVLMAHFSHCGEIVRATLPSDGFSGQHKGYGFIEFSDKAGVAAALLLTDSLLLGREIKVVEKNKRGPPPVAAPAPAARRSLADAPALPGGRKHLVWTRSEAGMAQ